MGAAAAYNGVSARAPSLLRTVKHVPYAKESGFRQASRGVLSRRVEAAHERSRFINPPCPRRRSRRINSSPHHNCPSCRAPVTLALLRKGVAPEEQQAQQAAAEAAEAAAEAVALAGAPPGSVACESKLRVLMAELRAMRQADPTSKALVFTQ